MASHLKKRNKLQLDNCSFLIWISKRDTIWAEAWQNQQNHLCTQRRLRSALRIVTDFLTQATKTDQTVSMPMLIWVLDERKGYFVSYVLLRLISTKFTWPKFSLPGPVARWDVHLTCIQEVAGSLLWSGNILSWRWSWNHFYGHSLLTADSSRAVVSDWRKDVH